MIGSAYLVLKPLSAALADGDRIRSVIRGSGINQNGRSQGITAPSVDAQISLIQSVYKSANLDPADTGFLEAHGTGTAKGDPIEAKALGSVFGIQSRQGPVYLGSLKSNVGHLEEVSGIASMIEATLMLERGFILPNCDFQHPNPEVPLDTWGFQVPRQEIPWLGAGVRRASVSNFGFGGSNAHVILEEPPLRDEASSVTDLKGDLGKLIPVRHLLGSTSRLFVFSANDREALEHQLGRSLQYLKDRPEIFYRCLLSSLSLTLQRRTTFGWRAAFSASSSFELMHLMEKRDSKPTRASSRPRLAFVFTGQGAQWYAMGRELMHTYPIFTQVLLDAQRILRDLGADWSLVGMSSYCQIYNDLLD